MKRILAITLMLLPLMLLAQPRIGIVNSKQIFDLMPDKAVAESRLQAVSDSYHAEFEMLKSDFDKKFADYQSIAADASVPEAIKERRVQELQESDKKVREFERLVAGDLAARRATLTQPITARIQAAISEAAEQAALDVVFDTAVTPVAYAGPNTLDLTPAVKSLLGLQ